MAEPSEVYQEHVLDHYKHPRNKGVLEPATSSGRDTNPLCGDEITIYLRIDGSDRVSDVRFDGHGCAISQASASMLTEAVHGKTLAETAALGREDVLRLLGVSLTTARMKCALVPLEALRHALGRPLETTET